MSEERDGAGRKFLAMYVGVVTRNDDPEKLGRVKLRIPAVVEPESGWALPMGCPGGGAKHRGWFDPPDVGAEVCVFFHAGEVDKPYYMPGNWGRGESPGPVGGFSLPGPTGAAGPPEEISEVDAHLVKAYETAAWIMVFDDRPGKEKFYIAHKKKGDHIYIDGNSGSAEIKMTMLVSIKCDGIVNVDGNQVNVRGRAVMPNGKALF